MPYSIGIDPGLPGAIAILTPPGAFFAVEDMPVMMSGKGNAKVKNKVNGSALAKIIKGFGVPPTDVIVYLEQVSAFRDQGVAGVFSFGQSFGIVDGVISALSIPFVLVRPTVWKKEFGLLKQEKDVARTYAINLYPAAGLERKKDIGRADAILIARYGATR